jgi:hypothetical protein
MGKTNNNPKKSVAALELHMRAKCGTLRLKRPTSLQTLAVPVKLFSERHAVSLKVPSLDPSQLFTEHTSLKIHRVLKSEHNTEPILWEQETKNKNSGALCAKFVV